MSHDPRHVLVSSALRQGLYFLGTLLVTGIMVCLVTSAGGQDMEEEDKRNRRRCDCH